MSAHVEDALAILARTLGLTLVETAAEFQLRLTRCTDYADKANRPAWLARHALRERADELLDESHEMAKAADRINVEVPGQVDMFGGDS